MTAEACAEIVRRGDPDRWRCAMTAAPGKRAGLMALYAFNLEIARAAWAASEPLLAQIRLKWWDEAVEAIGAGGAPRQHEVMAPLAEAIRAAGLPRAPFAEMIAARMEEAEGAPADLAALERFLDRTGAGLMELAARHLGAGEAAVGPVRDFARGASAAAWLLAVPEMTARGRVALPEGEATVRALARAGREGIARARAARGLVPRGAAAALLPGRLADGVLRRAEAEPGLAAAGGLAPSEFQQRWSLLWRGLSGRW